MAKGRRSSVRGLHYCPYVGPYVRTILQESRTKYRAAAFCQAVGRSRQSIWNYEHLGAMPSWDFFARAQEFLRVDVLTEQRYNELFSLYAVEQQYKRSKRYE